MAGSLETGGWAPGAVRVARVHTSSLGLSQVGRAAARLPYLGASGLQLCEMADGGEAEGTDVPCTDLVNPLSYPSFLFPSSRRLGLQLQDPKGTEISLETLFIQPCCPLASSLPPSPLPSFLSSLPCSIHLPKFVDILCVDDHFLWFLIFSGLAHKKISLIVLYNICQY